MVRVQVKDVRVERIIFRSNVLCREVLGHGGGADGLVDHFIKGPVFLHVYLTLEFIVSQVSQGQPAHKLSIGFDNFGGQVQSYVSRWSKVAS